MRAREADDFHARGQRGGDADRGIFDDAALRWRHLQTVGR
jgi:hypothetical protein